MDRAQTWEAKLSELVELNELVYAPIEPGVLKAVAALSLLRFPTIASCEGHFRADWPSLPYVLMDFAPPRRLLGLEEQPQGARERAYLAAVAWRVKRPRRDQLRALLAEFYADRSTAPAFRLRAYAGLSGFGVASSVEALCLFKEGLLPGAEVVGRCQAEMQDFGSYLETRWLGAGFAGLDGSWKGHRARAIGEQLKLLDPDGWSPAKGAAPRLSPLQTTAAAAPEPTAAELARIEI